MAKYGEAFLFLEPAAGAAGDRVTVLNGETLLAWVPDTDAAVALAAELAADGIRLIELYRGFDLAAATEVIHAVDGRAPVGLAGYGFGATGRRPHHSVSVYAHPDADPATDRLVRRHPDGGTTTVVGAPDAAAATAVALELVNQGADLIEICGGTDLTTAGAIARTLGDRATVSVVTWPFESITAAAAYRAEFEAAHTA